MPRANFLVGKAIGVLVVLAVIGGCVSSRKPAAPPLVSDQSAVVSVHYFQGTPLSGTILKPVTAVDPNEALAVEISFYALEKNPQGVAPLGAHARLIIASHGANPVRSTGGLTRTATYAIGPDADRISSKMMRGDFERRVPVGTISAVLAPGTTARFEITDSGKPDVTLPSGLGHRRFQLQICRPENHLFTPNKVNTQLATAPASKGVELETAVVLDDVAAAEPIGSGETPDANGGASTSPPMATLHLETVLLDPLTLDPGNPSDQRPGMVVAVPFRLRGASNRSIAAVVRITRGSPRTRAFIALCDSANKDLADSYAAALTDAATRPPATPDEVTVKDLLASIARPPSRRAAAAYLAAWSGARICEDAILSCDDKLLGELTLAFSGEVAKVARDKPSVGWRMDRITLEFLVKLQNDNELPPELTALLCDRAGEAGRHAGAMQEVLKGVSGPMDLDQRLVATNRLYLEDSSPGSRARAFDWLKNRNRHEEPAGYGPLDPSRQRRDTLDQDLQDRAEAATRPATQPTGVP